MCITTQLLFALRCFAEVFGSEVVWTPPIKMGGEWTVITWQSKQLEAASCSLLRLENLQSCDGLREPQDPKSPKKWSTLQPDNTTYINACLGINFLKFSFSYIIINFSNYFQKITLHLFVCDTEHYMEKLSWSYFLGKSQFSYINSVLGIEFAKIFDWSVAQK